MMSPKHVKEKLAFGQFFFYVLRGPESNGRLQVMSLMRYRFSTPLYSSAYYTIIAIFCNIS